MRSRSPPLYKVIASAAVVSEREAGAAVCAMQESTAIASTNFICGKVRRMGLAFAASLKVAILAGKAKPPRHLQNCERGRNF
jgi:hypothetical protein